jgi:hypothetical protein
MRQDITVKIIAYYRDILPYIISLVITCASVALASYFARPPCFYFEYGPLKGNGAEETVNGIMPIQASVKVSELIYKLK